MWAAAVAVLMAVLVLLSWAGLGRAIICLLRLHGSIRRDEPLQACVGMAAMTVLGGILMALSIVNTDLLFVLTIFFAIFAHYWLPRNRSPIRPSLPAIILGLACAWVLFAAAINNNVNPGDDYLAYIVFPKQILESGTLYAPFNLRRLGIYGGHQFLQAQLLALFQSDRWGPGISFALHHPHLIDQGLATILTAALLYTLAGRKWLGLLVAGAFFLTPLPRANAHAQATGMLLFVALARLLPLLWKHPRIILFTALIAAAIGSLRMNFTAAATLVPLFACIP
jgi:hypothetical protein